jgi:hypothetical protein
MPKTEAGKKLLALIDDGTDECVWMSKDIDAIEAEAFAAGDRQGWDSGIIAERERIKTAVWKERIYVGSRGREIAGGWVSRAAVLRIIERDDVAEYQRAMHRGMP